MQRISKTDLIRLQKTLKTDQAIADKFNITWQYVHQMRQRYGIQSLLKDTADRNNKIVTMFKNGMTGAEIAKKVRLSVFYVYKIVSYAGVSRKKQRNLSRIVRR